MTTDAATDLLATFPEHSDEWNTLRQLIGYRAEYRRLRHELATPPAGWFTFGHHVGMDEYRQLEFWGDEGGIPLWERPALTDEQTRDIIDDAIRAITQVTNNETLSWNLWNTLNTSPAVIAAFEEMRRRGAPRMEET